MSVGLRVHHAHLAPERREESGHDDSARPTDAVQCNAEAPGAETLHVKVGEFEDPLDVAPDRLPIFPDRAEPVPSGPLRLHPREEPLEALHLRNVEEAPAGAGKLESVPFRRVVAGRDGHGSGRAGVAGREENRRRRGEPNVDHIRPRADKPGAGRVREHPPRGARVPAEIDGSVATLAAEKGPEGRRDRGDQLRREA